MEMANITYQDEDGNIKVRIDYDKCIVCGRCVLACKHDARYFLDDLDQFFNDLKDSVPISLIAAPSIRTNIPNYKRLFTYLKQRGVNKIYDVSLGADICIWGHIKYLEKNNAAHIITQPCPVVVTYCEMYSHNLLKRLSPVHSPMACTSIYIKKYQGIDDRIAALSPCLAKANEFGDTKLANYNITFARLLEYMKKNHVSLPIEETEFDHDESGLGSLFPMPGGLKENIEYFMGKKIHIAKAEGFDVYEKLNKYEETPEEFLPEIYDVLNCVEGCNIGPASLHERNLFEIDKTMNNNRRKAMEDFKREHYESVYKIYDEKFDLSHFLREYRPILATFPIITAADISNAFELLGKTDYGKQNIDCSACGSETCHHMARKIALGVNIPINCIVKSMDDAKIEHASNILAHQELAEMAKMREADERMRIMLDATPLCAHFWDENLKIVDCNQAAVRLFNLKNKQEYIEKYFELTPELQPDGHSSIDKLKEYIGKAYKKGYHRVEWMRQTLDGEPLPVELTLVLVEFKGKNLIAGYCRDLREHKRMMQELNTSTKKVKTALGKAERAVRALEVAQFTTSAMFGSNPQINILFDSKYNVIDCNPAAVNFFGFKTKDDMLAGAVERIIESIPAFQPDGSASVSLAESLNTATEKGYIKFDAEVIMGGVQRSLNLEFKKIPYEKSFAIVSYLYDMTDIREHEKELIRIREQNELQLAKLNQVLKATKIGLWDMKVMRDDPVNPDNSIMWSDEFRNLLGYTSENDFQNIVRSFNEHLHPEDKERVPSTFVKHLMDTTGKTPYDIEYRLRKKNGEYSYYRASGETIRDEDGNPVRVAGALMDITDAKNILLNNELQLIKLNLMVQATKIGLWDMKVEKDNPINPKNTFTWSDDFRHMLGYTDENDFPNIFSSWSSCIHPEDKERTLALFEKHLFDTTGKTPFDIEYRMFKKNGECAYFRDTGETIRDEDGNPIHIAGALLDVTDVKKLIQETQRQRMEAEAANKAKSAFLSTMSHEIRTPMNAILGITDIQLQNDSLDKKTREALEKIYTSGDLLLGIINDMLDLSKIEAGKMELNIGRYEITSLLSDTAQVNMMRIGSKPIEFELYAAEDTPSSLLGDELRVKQILNNLLSNAFKYTDAGMVKMSVSTEEIDKKGKEVMLVISISDTGQGMTEEQVSKLFDEYVRFNMKANRSTEGTGLGMSIAQNLVRMMNGEILIKSELGKGSVFTVRLPQCRVSSEVLGSEMVKNLHQFRANNKAQMKRVQISREPMPYGSVLIVDDVETNIYVCKGLLLPYKLKTDSAESGFEAIEKIKEGNVYDIVFMDHMMPKMDGIEATKIIRDMGYKNPIVALTANAVSGQADIFLRSGFDDFISKPIDVRHLNTVLNKLIRDKQSPEVIEAARTEASAKNDKSSKNAAQNAPAIDSRFAKIFIKDALKSITALDAISKKESYNKDIRTYIIHVHGMKGALANIGKKDIANIASKLEISARSDDTETLLSETPAFLDLLRAVVEELTQKVETESSDTADEDLSYLQEQLSALKAACENYDEKTAENIIAEIGKKTWSKATKELLSSISGNLLHSDFDEVVKVINKFMETL